MALSSFSDEIWQLLVFGVSFTKHILIFLIPKSVYPKAEREKLPLEFDNKIIGMSSRIDTNSHSDKNDEVHIWEETEIMYLFSPKCFFFKQVWLINTKLWKGKQLSNNATNSKAAFFVSSIFMSGGVAWTPWSTGMVTCSRTQHMSCNKICQLWIW